MQTHPTPTSIARNLSPGAGDLELLRAGATIIEDLNIEVDRAGSRGGKLNPDSTASARCDLVSAVIHLLVIGPDNNFSDIQASAEELVGMWRA